jgi:hypothetical protein
MIEDLVKSENEITEARPTKSRSSTGRTKMTPPTKNLRNLRVQPVMSSSSPPRMKTTPTSDGKRLE